MASTLGISLYSNLSTTYAAIIDSLRVVIDQYTIETSRSDLITEQPSASMEVRMVGTGVGIVVISCLRLYYRSSKESIEKVDLFIFLVTVYNNVTTQLAWGNKFVSFGEMTALGWSTFS